jgi:hypothetical protein
MNINGEEQATTIARGIEGILIETHNWSGIAAFWRGLGKPFRLTGRRSANYC